MQKSKLVSEPEGAPENNFSEYSPIGKNSYDIVMFRNIPLLFLN